MSLESFMVHTASRELPLEVCEEASKGVREVGGSGCVCLSVWPQEHEYGSARYVGGEEGLDMSVCGCDHDIVWLWMSGSGHVYVYVCACVYLLMHKASTGVASDRV